MVSETLWPKYKRETHVVVFIEPVPQQESTQGLVKFPVTETHFVVFMSQSVSRRSSTQGFVTFPVRSNLRMMISTPTLCISSSRVPQPGICVNSTVSLSPSTTPAVLKWSSGSRKGRRYSTLATKPASSVFSGAEDAFRDQVPAKTTGVRDSTGTKNVELMDPISRAKLVSTIDDQLPPLLSMFVDGLPPVQLSKYAQEAEKRLQQYVERYEEVDSWGSCCRVGLDAVNYWHPGVISVDRFVAMAISYALINWLDDFFFDTPYEFRHDQYGFSREVRESPQKIQEYLTHLAAVFSQQVQPRNPAPWIETLMWESGRDMLELSNTEWFSNYVAAFVEFLRASLASHVDIVQGKNSCFQDLESYSAMRAGNVCGNCVQTLIEFASNSYIPSSMKATPYFKNVTTTTSIYIGFINDVFSYHKESLIEQNPRNLITVLMECEGKPFVQTVHRAVGLVNAHASAILDLEAKAWNSTLQNHLENTKALIVGMIYYHFIQKRYRHPQSIFPELRDMTSSWKSLPHAKDLGL